MTGSPVDLGGLLAQTFRDPDGVARRIISLRLGGQVLLPALALVAVLTVLIMVAMSAVFGSVAAPLAAMVSHRLAGVATQAGGVALLAAAVGLIGRLCGGQGRVIEALALVIWIELVMVLLAAAQFVALLILPLLA